MPKGSGGGGRSGRSGGGPPAQSMPVKPSGPSLDYDAATFSELLKMDYIAKGAHVSTSGDTVQMLGKGGKSEKLVVSTAATGKPGIKQGTSRFALTSDGMANALKSFDAKNKIENPIVGRM